MAMYAASRWLLITLCFFGKFGEQRLGLGLFALHAKAAEEIEALASVIHRTPVVPLVVFQLSDAQAYTGDEIGAPALLCERQALIVTGARAHTVPYSVLQHAQVNPVRRDIRNIALLLGVLDGLLIPHCRVRGLPAPRGEVPEAGLQIWEPVDSAY